jgi:uncharacterized protein
MKIPCPSLLLALCLATAGNALATPISLSTQGITYTQNFDTLAASPGTFANATLPVGWTLAETGGGTRDNEQYGVDAGTSNIGDIYSYGTAGSTERALGSLRSGTLIPIFGAEFRNDTGATISSLDIAFIGEQWRLGTANRNDRLAFQYSTNASSLTDGTYLAFDILDFVTPNTATAGAKNGNETGNFVALSATITGLEIATNTNFWLRWIDIDASGADDGLAIDEFSLTPQGANSPPPKTIPEPDTLALAMMTLIVLCTMRRRKQVI